MKLTETQTTVLRLCREVAQNAFYVGFTLGKAEEGLREDADRLFTEWWVLVEKGTDEKLAGL